VRSVYIESSSMFVRGGVYVVVRDAMGSFVARFSVSSLIFDYILTGPISVVCAGQYLARLMNEVSEMTHSPLRVDPFQFAAYFGVAVTIYFWWSNTKGIHESSGKALRIMQITSVMVIAFMIWCPLTLLVRGPAQIPPPPTIPNLHFSDDGLGWFKGTVFPQIWAAALIIAFGHSLLSMSGFETLAQIYREIAYPKLKNLKLTGNITCIYAVICTGVITLFAGMIIPDKVRPIRRKPAGRTHFVPSRAAVAAAVFPHLCGHGGRADSFRRREHFDYRRQRRDEPRGRGRRFAGLVPQAAPALRQHLPHHQYGRAAANRHHRAQPRRYEPARRSVRIRRGVELLHEVAGRAGAALSPPRPGI
jgi:hypothetical protein